MLTFGNRVEMALVCSKANGKKIKKKALASKLWPNSSPEARGVSMRNLLSGETTYIKSEWVPLICETCGVTPNYLFGYED